MVLWLRTQVLEDALLPEPLHQVPVLHNTMSDGILAGIAHMIRLISDVKVWGREERREGRREGEREGGREREREGVREGESERE